MARPMVRRLTLEHFEDRNLPAPLTFSMDFLGNLTISGTPDNANGGLSIVATAPNTFDITDGATPVLTGVVVSGNITVNLANGTDDTVTLDLTAGGLGGSFSLNAGSGTDTFNFTGASGIGGNLNLTNVNLSTPVGVVVGGNTTINSSSENPVIPNTFIFTSSTFGGDVRFTGGNTSDQFDLAVSIVGGNVSLSMGNSVGGTNVSDLTSGTVIGGNLTYTGGSGEDSIFLTDVTIGGGVTANMGSAITSGTSNNLTATTAIIGRGLSVIGGTGVDTMSVDAASTIGTTADFRLGEGANTVDFLGSFGSTSGSFYYSGGSGVDDVEFTPAAGSSRVRFTATLGGGNDIVAFGASTAPPSFAYVDFGAGTDSVTGTINFPFTFLNLP